MDIAHSVAKGAFDSRAAYVDATPERDTRSLRILHLGRFDGAWSNETVIDVCLRARGHEVTAVHEFTASAELLRGELARVHYDCLLFHKGRIGASSLEEILRPDGTEIARFLEECGVPAYLWYFDRAFGYEREPSREEWMRRVAPLCRLSFVVDGGLLATDWACWRLLREGAHSIATDMLPPVAESEKRDLAFVGQVYGARQRELEAISKHFHVDVIDDAFGPALGEIVRSYRVILGLNYPSAPGYWSNRLYLTLGHGGFFLAPQVEGMRDDGFMPGVHYAALGDDAVSDIRAWLGRPDDRARIAAQGRALVHERHTMAHRVAELCSQIRSTVDEPVPATRGSKRLVGLTTVSAECSAGASAGHREAIQAGRRPMIVPLIPYCPSDRGQNLGFAYNALMERLDEDDWACFIDHDACFTTPRWYRQLESIVAEHPEPCVLTAVTNRVGSPWQRVDGVDPDNHSLRDHRRIGAALAEQHGSQVTDATEFGLMSGVVIALSKRTWRRLGGFCDGFLGVDNDLHRRARDAGVRVYRMDGVYVYHWYRGDGESPGAIDAQADQTLAAGRPSASQALVAAVPSSAQRILVLGEAESEAAQCLRSRPGVHVATCGAEQNALEASTAAQEVDCAVFAERLGRCSDPLALLRALRPRLSTDARVIARAGNLRHHETISALLNGRWIGAPAGGMDASAEARFFTRREIEKLFYRAGFTGVMCTADENSELLDRRGQGATRDLVIDGLHLGRLTAGEAEEFLAREFLVSALPARRPSYGLTSIVLVTFNELGYTRHCVNSLLQFTDPPFELLVVDNGSTDGTVDYLRSLEGVTLLENGENRGFPAAANQGVRASRGEHVLLLNNDTVVTTGWLDRMLAALHRDERVGLVGPTSNNVSGPQLIQAGYQELASLDGFAWEWGRAHDGQVEAVDRLVGFCLLFRRSLIDEIGLLDERFGIGNFEDDDFGLRAIEAGYRLLIARDAFVHHFGNRTFQGAGVDYAALMRENQRKFEAKWESRTPPRRRQQAAASLERPADPPRSTDPSPTLAPLGVRMAEEGGLLLVPQAVRLSLAMIVRNNEGTLEPCLASIAPWVDELIVVDTGSTDRTPEIARKYGARLFEFPWCDDFAAARNESLRHARGEWIFWMDSDDTISADCGRQLRALADGQHEPNVLGYVMQVHCPAGGAHGESEVTAVDHVKLIRNLPELRFENRIHEQILPAIRRAGGEVGWTEIFVVHAGSDQSDEGRRRKQLRDLRLLELEDREKPHHPFTLFNLGMTYVDMDEPARASGYLERSIAVAGPDESHLRKAFALLVGCYAQCERLDDAERTCRAALEQFPGDPELLFRHGILAHRGGRYDDAVQAYRQILDRSAERHFSSLDRGILGYKTRHNLALVYLDAGRPNDAEREWRLALDEVPGYREGWRGLADVLLQLDQRDEVGRIAERLERDPALRHEGLLIASRAARARGDDAQARALLETAIAEFPTDADALRALCQLLFETDDLDAAEHRQRALVTLAPDDASALQNLGTIHLRQGRPEDAVAPLRESLRLRPDSPVARAHLDAALGSVASMSSPLAAL